MLELSKRLSLIAQFVNEGSSVCDVGTDHGYLPAFLFLSGRCRSVCATDINQKPLESAKTNLKRLGVDGVRLVLCDGLAQISRADADTVIIAGMGGEVISGIINRASFLKDHTVSLILQPTTAAKELRLFLAKNGFTIEREKAIAENGKIYSVMCARFKGQPYDIDDVKAVIGLLKNDSDDACAYIEKQYRIAQKCAIDLSGVAHKQTEYKHYLNLSEKLKNILGG
ncbi:MAG: SAM-dependent methyltransferase [Clostridia bacterium]|nr:SAM-dependent methyltransferase [Clostridia bacterium]